MAVPDSPTALLLCGLVAAVWIGGVGLGRVRRPVLTLTLAGAVFGDLLVVSFASGTRPDVDGVLAVLVAGSEVARSTALGVIAGVVAAVVQTSRSPRPLPAARLGPATGCAARSTSTPRRWRRRADGALVIGCLWRSRKALDGLRDLPVALNCGSVDPPARTGDAEVAGRAEEVTDRALVEAVNGISGGPSHLFRADVGEVVVCPGEPADRVVVESWRPGRGLARHQQW